MAGLFIYGRKVDRKINTNRNVSYLVPEKNGVGKQNWQCDEARLGKTFLDTNAWLVTGTVLSANNGGKCPSVVQWLREARTGLGIHNLHTVPTKCINTAYNFKELCPRVPQNSVNNVKCPGLFQVIKYDISDSACQYFDFARAGQASTSH